MSSHMIVSQVFKVVHSMLSFFPVLRKDRRQKPLKDSNNSGETLLIPLFIKIGLVELLEAYSLKVAYTTVPQWKTS